MCSRTLLKMPETSDPITIRLNGESCVVESGERLVALLERMGARSGRVAVELNREIVPKAEYENVVLRDGDELEVINFVGGG
jgi:sulfur carrier protein